MKLIRHINLNVVMIILNPRYAGRHSNTKAIKNYHTSHYIRLSILSYITIIMYFASAGVLMADTVNGEWCSVNGQRLVIKHSEIITPGGLNTYGDYDVHHYQFKLPSEEKDGDVTMDIVLVDENTIHTRYIMGSAGQHNSQLERWKRCAASTS